MRILQINAVNGIKSTGRIVLEMTDYFNNIGHEGYVACAESFNCESVYQIGSPLEKKMHALFSRVFGKQGYYSKEGTRNFIKYMDRLKPDVVHLHNLHGNYINLNLLLNYLAKNDIPTVITLHDCWFYTGKCTHYTVDNCHKWQSGCEKCSRLKKDNSSWFFDRTKEMYNDKKKWFENIPRLAVVGVSDWITNEAKKSFLSSAKIVTRIYNWVDLDVFRPVNAGVLRHKLHLENKFVILGVASDWSNAKGLDKFIELASLVEGNMCIILVGNLNQQALLPKNIIHVRETFSIDELVEYYSLADVFVNLSLEESFGIVTAEALACGTPVVVINSTANPELVVEGCGYLIEENCINNVKIAILKVSSVGKKYYSETCVAFAKSSFCKDERIQDYINIYQRLLVIGKEK